MNDLRYALRSLSNHPGFVAVAVLTLAIGIGGTTTMFGVVNALFWSAPAGVSDPGQVVRIYIARRSGRITNPDGGGGSYPDLQAMRAAGGGFTGPAGFSYTRSFDYGRGHRAQRISGWGVTADFFSVLGVRPALGRLLDLGDEAASAGAVAVLGHSFWRREFGGDNSVIGRGIELDGEPFTVVGVVDGEFTGLGAERVDVWVPLASVEPRLMSEPLAGWVNYLARLAPAASREQVVANWDAALRHAANAVPGLDPEPSVLLGPLSDAGGPKRSQSERIALWLALATGMVLVIACANVANLLLARGATRRREMAVRLSLGVSGGRLVRQLLTESLVLGLLGGSVGLLLVVWGAELVRQFPLPPSAGGLDPGLIGFTVAISVATGLIFGMAPALQALRTDPAAGLKAADAAEPGRGRFRSGLVAVQVALSLTLLVGAGLFVRSLGRVLAIEPGVDTDRLLVAWLKLRHAGYDAAAADAFYDRALERLNGLPGVERASVARIAPLQPAAMPISFEVPGRDTLTIGQGPYHNVVAPGFFQTAGIRLLRGREFDARDRAGGEPVAIVNEAMERLLADGGDAVGMCVPLGEQTRTGGCTRIVGVVVHARVRYLDEEIVPYVYLPRGQHALGMVFIPQILIRARGKAEALVPTVRAALQSLDARLPYVNVQPVTSFYERRILPFRIGARLFVLFGLLALGMAAVGLYGVLAHLVAQRTREIGVRVSLGARAAQVVRLVIGQGMLPVTIGLSLGLVASLAATRFLASLLYGVSPRDPVTFVVVPLVLIASALLASWLPAWRATKVDPMVALRYE